MIRVPKKIPCAAAQHVLGAHYSRHLAAKSEATVCCGTVGMYVSGAHCSRHLAAELEAAYGVVPAALVRRSFNVPIQNMY